MTFGILSVIAVKDSLFPSTKMKVLPYQILVFKVGTDLTETDRKTELLLTLVYIL